VNYQVPTSWQAIAGTACRPVYGFHDPEPDFVWSTFAFGLYFPPNGVAPGTPLLTVSNLHDEITLSCRIGAEVFAARVPHGVQRIMLDPACAGQFVDFSITPKVLLGVDFRELGLMIHGVEWTQEPWPEACWLRQQATLSSDRASDQDGLDRVRDAAKTLGNHAVGSFLNEGWFTVAWSESKRTIDLSIHAPLRMQLDATIDAACKINEREQVVTFVREPKSRNVYRTELRVSDIVGRSVELRELEQPFDIELHPHAIGRFRWQSAHWRGAGNDGLPDYQNILRVAGPAYLENFLLQGATWFVKFERLVKEHLPGGMAATQRIVDWGCGCARIARHFPEPHRRKFLGFDIDPVNVAWCRDHVRGMRFEHCAVEPPLVLEDNSVDVLFAHSVLTHLAEDRQDRWLAEIRRVLRPGGLAFVTVLAELSWYARYWPTGRTPEAIAAYLSTGFVDHGWQKDVGVDSDCPGAYVQVSHGFDYVSRHWSRFFEIVDWIDGFADMQTLVVLRK
jgi:SAM-dependent methyltransferase